MNKHRDRMLPLCSVRVQSTAVTSNASGSSDRGTFVAIAGTSQMNGSVAQSKTADMPRTSEMEPCWRKETCRLNRGICNEKENEQSK